MSQKSVDPMESIPTRATQRTAIERRINVWLVEHNATSRATIARVLSEVPGVTCARLFATAEDALAAFATNAVPDVVLLDVELPGRTGIDAVSRIKATSPSTNIIMLAMFNDYDRIFRALRAGASGYLLKTSPAEKLIESIREVHAGGAPMMSQAGRPMSEIFNVLAAPHPDYSLTHREREILELTAEGLLKKEIADRLSLSYHTVDTHLRSIFTKLHVHTRASAVAKAIKEHLF